MKRIIGLIVSVVVAFACASFFVGCADQNRIDEMGLVIDQETMIDYYESNGETVIDKDNKYIKFVFEGQYGGTFPIDSIKPYCNYKNGKAGYVPQKTDAADGYVLESNLPDNPGVGEYTLKYTYGDWTNEVVVRVNKRKIDIPHLEYDEETGFFIEYTYTGESITPQISYDQAYVDLVTVDVAKTNVGAYELEFALKDKANTGWYSTDGNYSTDNKSVTWNIEKQSILIGKNLLWTDIDGYDYDEATNTFTFDYTGQAIACPIKVDLIDLNKVEIYYGTNTSDMTIMRPIESGTYNVYLVLKDENNYKFVGLDGEAPNVNSTTHLLATMVIA